MIKLAATINRYGDYFMLVRPRRVGATIGFYSGLPIAAAVDGDFGRRYVYAGVALRNRDGTYDVESLRTGEWIVEPGLVYYRDPRIPPDLSRGSLVRLKSWLGQIDKRMHGH